MPLVSLTLPNITQSVERPVVFSVADQVRLATNIGSDVPIFYLNDEGELSSAGSTLDGKHDERLTRSESLRRIVISSLTSYAEDQQVTDVSGRMGNHPIFVDNSLGVWMAPASTSTSVELSFDFYTRSKEEARRWRDDVAHRYIQGRQALKHQVTYSYTLPLVTYYLIRDIWQKRENIAGHGQTLEQYVSVCMSNQLQLISDETGKNAQLTLACSQDRIQGYFDFTNEPNKIEHDKDNGTYRASFKYKFVYQCPVMLDMCYPIIVHQQLLSERFIEFCNKGPQEDDRAVIRSQYLWGLKPMESMDWMRVMKPRYPFVRIPEIDDFRLNYFFPGTGMYLLVLLQQPNKETLAFNMRELGDVVLDPDILDFLASGEYQYVGKPGKSIFHMDLYCNDSLCDYPSLAIDQDLNVTILEEIELRAVYRVRCALYTDLSFIDRSALDRLMQHPKAFQKILGAINNLLRYDSSFQKLGDQKQIYPWQLTKVYEAIMGQGTCNIYTGQASSQMTQAWGSQWVHNNRTFLTDIPKNVLDTYRTLRKTKMDIQLLGVVSYDKDRDLSLAKSQGLA